MKLPKPSSLKEISSIIKANAIGNDDFQITGFNEIHKVEKGDLTFVDHPKYYEKALQSAATTILINKQVECPAGKALIISDDPFRDYARDSELRIAIGKKLLNLVADGVTDPLRLRNLTVQGLLLRPH